MVSGYLIPFSFFHFFLPYSFFLRQGFCVYVTFWKLLELQTKLALNSWNSPISASPVRKLKVCTTKVQFIIYLFIFDYRSSHLGDFLFQKTIRGCTFMYVWLFCQSVCLHTTYMPDAHGSQRDNQIPRTGVTYRWVLSPTWVLGIEHGSFGKVVSAFHHRAISPALVFVLIFRNSGKLSAWYDLLLMDTWS